MPDFDQALQQWRAVLGNQFVETAQDSLDRAATATFATQQTVSAILHPANREQIQECLAIANRWGTPVYPISTGKNWGYGSRVPPASGSAILHLGRLNKILDFSEDLGYVTVEPGVTQSQLFAFLQNARSRFWMDATGSSPETSLIGNCMERGFGHTPMGDRFAQVCGLEVILPSGEIVQSGAAGFAGALTASVSRWGVGPSVDGLFSQSNLGIVTRMTVWLMPRPDCFEAFFFRAETDGSLPALITALRELRLKDILRSSIHIGNDYKVLAGLQQYPWQETGGSTPLQPAKIAEFRKRLGFGSWSASGGLYGTRAQVAESKRLLREALKHISGTLKFLSPEKLRFAKRWAKPFQMVSGWDLRRTVELVEPVMGLMQGVPTEQPMASAYWRKRTPPPKHGADPDRDRCGLLWYAPVSPANGNQVAALTQIATDTLLRFGFEPQISLTLLTPRTVSCIISIAYDRDVSGQDEQAHRCHEEVARLCSGQGYYPYRLSIAGAGNLEEDAGHAHLLQQIRKTLDPNGILAPGRYELSKSARPESASVNSSDQTPVPTYP